MSDPKKSPYLPLEESPTEIKTSQYVKLGFGSILREALPPDHPENLYNWFRKEYPNLNPHFYGIYKNNKYNEDDEEAIQPRCPHCHEHLSRENLSEMGLKRDVVEKVLKEGNTSVF